MTLSSWFLSAIPFLLVYVGKEQPEAFTQVSLEELRTPCFFLLVIEKRRASRGSTLYWPRARKTG
jgi:hypothetical protein